MKCENCNTNHKGEYGSGRFCCQKCARGFSTKEKRAEINAKVSKTIKKKFIKFCTICGREVNGRKTCSSKCLFELKSRNGKISGKVGGKISALSQQRRSKNEIYFADLCKAKFKNVETNIQIFNGWDADVIIHDIKVAILWNGKWHYEKITKKHSPSQVQIRDKIKIREIKKCGYIPYIIKDMGRHNIKFVESEFSKFEDLYLNG